MKSIIHNTKIKITGVFTGKISLLSNNQESAINKLPRDVLILKKDGIVGDEVADKKHHGGQLRAIHHYSQINYNHMKEKFPDISNRFIPGSFGENIVTEEMTEQELNIGDIYMLGTAKVQLTVCRRPCATINHTYNDNRILKEVIASGKTGWFYRVLEEGEVKAGDFLTFLERPYPDMSVLKLHEEGYGPSRFSDIAFLEKCLSTGLMDKGWKPKLENALISNKI